MPIWKIPLREPHYDRHTHRRPVYPAFHNRKYCGSVDMHLFREAVKQGKQFSTVRFDFRGYDGTLWCEPRENGDVMAGFSKEYRGCLNGYYYLLINDEYMIGYDID